MLSTTELAIKLNICIGIIKESAKDHHKCHGYKMTMRERQLVHKSCFQYLRGLSRANHSPQGVVQLPGLGQFSISPNRRIQASQVGKCGCKSQAVQHLHVGRSSVSQSFSVLLTGVMTHQHKNQCPLEMVCLKRTKTALIFVSYTFQFTFTHLTLLLESQAPNQCCSGRSFQSVLIPQQDPGLIKSMPLIICCGLCNFYIVRCHSSFFNCL